MWDLTVPGNNDHDFYVVAGTTSVLAHNVNCSTNAQILDSNMQAEGVSRPANTAAHHMVASTSPKAASARAQLQSFGIDIHDADNGVYLPAGLPLRTRWAWQCILRFTKISTTTQLME